MSDRTSERQASNTAGHTCFSRFCATREEDARFRHPDHMAEIFLPFCSKAIMSVSPLRRFFMKRIAPPGIYQYVSHHTPAELETTYLTADDGTRLRRMNETHCVVLAEAVQTELVALIGR